MKTICNPKAPEPIEKKLFYKGQTLFEWIHTTTLKDSVYSVDGIIHYVVDHTASLFWKTVTESISKEIKKIFR